MKFRTMPTKDRAKDEALARRLDEELVPAVGYLRMSSDPQELSIGQQEKAIKDYAEQNGYNVIRWYKDEGKSGSKDVEKRQGLQQLLLDSSKQDFRAVLCWDVSRFGRLDSIEAAFQKDILRKNGICLDTVKDGLLDWGTFEGRVKDTLMQEFAHQASLNLSKDTLRGRLDVLRAGYWPNGAVPYGYDKFYILAGQTRKVPRLTSAGKGRNERLKLVPNEAEAETVRLIFRLYVEEDYSLRRVGLELNRRGIPGPLNYGRTDSKGWDKDSVKNLLKNPVYYGAGHIGGGRRRAKSAFNRAEAMIVDGCFPHLVSKALWQQAQEKMKREQGRRGNGLKQDSPTDPLQGILYCARCGYALQRKWRSKRPGDVYFTCSSALHKPHLGCKQWTVRTEEVLPYLGPELVRVVDRQLLAAAQVQVNGQQPVTDKTLAEAQAEALKEQVRLAARRYLRAKPELQEVLLAELEQIQADLNKAEARCQLLQAVEEAGGPSAFAAWWEKVKPGLLMVSGAGVSKVTDSVPVEARGKDGTWKPVGFFVYDENGNEGAVLPQGRFTVSLPDGSPAPVVADPGKLRALLKRLGVKVWIKWKKAARYSMRQRKWAVDTARLKVEASWVDEGERSNKRSRGNNRDTG
jgi:DNA invertase Pin-like site-specific DNA recombinase